MKMTPPPVGSGGMNHASNPSTALSPPPSLAMMPTFRDRDASRLENIEPAASRLAGPGRCLLVFGDRGHRFGVLRVHPRSTSSALLSPT